MLQTNIRRGELDRKVYLIQPVLSNDSANAASLSGWELIATYPQMYARKKELPGKELILADRLTYVQTTIWTIVYRDDLTNRNRVVYNSRPYEIIALVENGRGRYLDIHANLVDNETWTAPEGEFSEEFSDEFAT